MNNYYDNNNDFLNSKENIVDNKNIEYEDIDDEDFDEDEDEYGLSLDSFNDLYFYNLDIGLEIINVYFEKRRFDFDPDFQRRDSWSLKKKSRFIESLILNIPTPSILLANDVKSNKYIIVDGKQRLNTIKSFMDIKSFKLTNLQILTELNGKNYNDLKSCEKYSSYLSQLEKYVIKATVIRNYNERLLYFVFARLNSGSEPLTDQELRYSLYPGEFSKFIETSLGKCKNIKKFLNISKTTALDKRMRDSELLCRFYAFKFFLQNYSNSVAALLDYTYEQLNKNWADMHSVVEQSLVEFENSMEFIYKEFGKNAFTIYKTEEGCHTKKSKLVYDLLVPFFSNSKNREIVNMNKNINISDFFDSCFYDKEFNEAFKPTTSSQEKTFTRFKRFKELFDKSYNK